MTVEDGESVTMNSQTILSNTFSLNSIFALIDMLFLFENFSKLIVLFFQCIILDQMRSQYQRSYA